MSEDKEYSPKRFATSSVACPACAAKLDREAKWCDTCGFTGEKSLQIFGDSPPPLLPILDVADLWDEKAKGVIRRAVRSFNKRFPQIHWRICAVALEPEVQLPLFGFWLMNVSPLNVGETVEDREWTVLLLIDENTGKACVTTGYRVEVWLSDEWWTRALSEIKIPFRHARSEQGVKNFLKKSQELFDHAWKRSVKQLKK